ncbi:MAG: ribosome hibernation-promoting factor, HPF/YfiA family [Rhabdochlamydiaceae bacterium]
MVDKAKFTEQEEALGRRIDIRGRNVFVTDSMKQHAYEKLSKIERFHNHIMDIHVTMDVQKMEQSVIVMLHLEHFRVKVSASSSDMYASIDEAVKKLQAKIRRWKSRIQDHHKKARSVVDMQINVLKRPFTDLDFINEAIELENAEHAMEEYEAPHIIGTDTRPMKTLTTEEAIMKMELSDDNFMLYRCEEDHKLKVIYRRRDGHYGLILPE